MKVEIKRHNKTPVVFDATGFARLLVQRRSDLGLSTRQLAQRAHISQPYVVALERAKTTGTPGGPSPTVDMLARLATALQMNASDLFRYSIKPAGKHILLLIEDLDRTSLQRVRQAVASTQASMTSPDSWLIANSSASQRSNDSLSIRLHRDTKHAYKPKAISNSLNFELKRHKQSVAGKQVGLIFDEISSLLSSVSNPLSIVAFEHDWADVVTSATDAVGAFASHNVCVYNIHNLLDLEDPTKVALELLRTHTDVWSARKKTISQGPTAAMRLLSLVRPSDISTKNWNQYSNSLISDLQLSA